MVRNCVIQNFRRHQQYETLRNPSNQLSLFRATSSAVYVTHSYTINFTLRSTQ